ncbi:MAG: ComEC/Rec2 family competence protein [Patescibacteria group bacterium]|jgi:competence protein ComEC
MSKNNFFLIAGVSFVVGLFLAHYLFFIQNLPSLFYFSFLLIFLFFLIKFNSKIYLILFFIFLAIWRYSFLLGDDLSGKIENYYDYEFKIFGGVINDPEIKNDKQKIKLKIICGQDNLANFFKLEGNILLSSFLYPTYSYGDYLEVEGQYLEPGLIDDFNYSLYLKRYKITAVAYYPKIKKIDLLELQNFSNDSLPSICFSNNFFTKLRIYFLNYIYDFKSKTAEKFNLFLSVDSSAILKGMILGDKSDLTTENREIFSRAGLSHIIAISGLHISLLCSLLLSLLLFIGLSRKSSFYLSVLFLFLYLILIGFPASAIRASIMGFFSFLAIYMGRVGNLVNALFLTLLILLLVNPYLVFVDIGFQLSFLAVLGIIYFHPLVKDAILSKINMKIKIRESIIDIISLTISVQLITAPILISNFEQFSLIAPISNLLVLFLLPIIISLSIIALIISFLIPFLAQFVYFFIELFLRYIYLVAVWSIKIPGASINIANWSLFLSIIYYFLLFYFFYKYRKRK